MPTTPQQQVETIIAQLKDFTAANIIQLAVAVHRHITVPTPVRTGWARANWIPAVGDQSETARPRPGDDDVAAAVTAVEAQQRAGLASLASYTLERDDITIANNVPYIVDLNMGTSRQAPRAFVQTAIRRAIDEVT